MKDDLFDDIDPDGLDEPIEEPKWKKPLFITIGIFLVILIFSLSFNLYILFDVFFSDIFLFHNFVILSYNCHKEFILLC